MKDNPPIWIKFLFKGNEFYIENKDKISFVHWEKEYHQYNWFWWEEGNGSCDCNRSLEIIRTYPEFKELNCGDEITINDYGVINTPPSED